jgi:hypothetical protein
VHLAAAGLPAGEDDLVAEPPQHLHGRPAGLREERVADAGDEERDPHPADSITGAPVRYLDPKND